MVGKPNREILTGGKRYKQQSSRKHRVEEVVFDGEARVDYLTGFHRRKLQRRKKAQEFAKEQERLARLEERAKIREERKKNIHKQLEKYNRSIKELNGDVTGIDISSDSDLGDDVADDRDQDKNDSDFELEPEEDAAEWVGFDEEHENDVRGILKRKDVYISTSKNAPIKGKSSVEIEELTPNGVDITQIAHANFVDLTKSKEILDKSIERAKKYAELVNGTSKPRPKSKKKFRYLTKTERKANTRKEKSKGKR